MRQAISLSERNTARTACLTSPTTPASAIAVTRSSAVIVIPQRYHDRFPQREALRPPGSLIPGNRQDLFDTRLKFIELFGV
jgi:hypothetical protein